MNTLGNNFRLTTFGESHGFAEGGIIDGCPAGIAIDFDKICVDVSRRSGPRNEPDNIEWLSGILNGVTLGTPIAFLVRNTNADSSDYDALRNCFRPGHADYTYQAKYGIRDHRGGGRASARETVVRVIAGAIAKQLLPNITFATEIVTSNPQQDNIGGIIQCIVTGVPASVGDPLFDKLNARLAFAMMSIPSAIGFEMGIGFDGCSLSGREWADAWNTTTPDQLTLTNHCGGIQGGISNGMPITFRVAFHAICTQPDGMQCLHHDGSITNVAPGGRHDRYHLPRAQVIVEAMAALTLADLIKQQ